MADRFDEWARALVESETTNFRVIEGLAPKIAAALRQVERETRERCAQIMEVHDEVRFADIKKSRTPDND
jgi:hypothetical protein